MTMDEFLRQLFARAKEENFSAAEAYISMGESFEANVVSGEINEYNVVNSAGLGFRALINGKMGYASTQVFDEDAIELLINGVRTNAALIENEDKQFIFPGSEKYPEADYYNPALDEVTAAEKLDLVKKLEKATLEADTHVTQTEDCRVFSETSSCRIVNSMGLDVSARDNAIGIYSVPVVKDGEKVNDGMGFAMKRDIAELDYEKVAREACEEAMSGLYAESVPSGEYPIVLRRDVAGRLLSTFSGVFSADVAQKGLSLLKGREGDVIASDIVSIVDDPLLKEGRVIETFDGEGVASFRKAVVEKGVLKTLLHNLKTAAKQGVDTTANASRASYSSPVSVAPTNFFIEKGGHTLEELFAEAGNGLMITDIQGMHSGANGISGDFSLSAKGFVIENGKKGASVKQITIGGNFFTLLKDITMIADDLEFTMSTIASPSLLVKKLTVAGK